MQNYSFPMKLQKRIAIIYMFLLFFNNSVNIRAIEGFFLQASPPALPHREGALQAERKRQSRAENGSFSMQNGVAEDNRDKGRQLLCSRVLQLHVSRRSRVCFKPGVLIFKRKP